MGQRGGKRPGAGRRAGSRNKLTAERKATLTELAQAHADDAMRALAEVSQTGSDAARVAASVAILDRAFGKPKQGVEVSGPNGAPVSVLDATKLSTAALREIMTAWADEAPNADEG